MQALQLDAIHQPAVVRDVPAPTPADGEILVKLHAAALNHRDVFIQQGKYAGIKLPCTLGADGAGEVAAHGENVPTDAPAVGTQVLINPGLRWGDNPRAQAKDFIILGMPDPGTFAEYITLPARYIRPMPAYLTFEQAAALPLAGLTAYRAAFTRAQVQAGERVLVTGIGGGVALLAAQFCAARGAEVWVTSSSEEKLTRAQTLGAKGGISYNAENWVKTLVQQAGGPFDVIIDSAGGDAFNSLLDAAAPGGRIVFFGGTLGNIPQLPPAKVFWKQLSLLGSTMGSEQDFDDMLQLVTEKSIVPVVDEVFPLAEGEAALRRLDAGAQFGKVVLKIV
ncbi:zinc-binding dehydrogenase [Hymenobacter arizonensis]|uniref:D-arabinose 1-dehydrogenase, Zn-dependent alcohol dehydrogenase family n=1 Tax=Hymenobacter arizonensis TaxID=1227077 RepID=A0A1I6ARN3_HYMAR|nr:zinc-binding dehydrogenase [Hymenobacter arizonensis]SFQ71368.1 D-arabinose 1-dehydrogenase, Zn-dependent alcohol dehydrogenase family [Hymenobacter arizonensis]